MRHISVFCLLILLLFPFRVKAQFNKGDVLLAGTINLSTQSNKTTDSDAATSTVNFSITPKLGFFINDNTAIGGSLGFSSFHNENGTSSSMSVTDNRSLSAGIFARRYFTISEKFFFVAETNLNFSRSSGKYTPFPDAASTQTESYNISLNMLPLLVFLPSPNWGFEGGIGSIGYSHGQNLKTNQYSNNFNLSAGNISLGVTYFFRKVNVE